MTPIRSVYSFTLDLPPSCVAFCPTQPQYFVVGTYHLHQQEQPNTSFNTAGAEDNETASASEQLPQQKRSGSLILFRVKDQTISHVVTRTTDYAILDVQWTPHSETLGDLLAVASSTGSLVFYKLEATRTGPDLVFWSLKSVADPSVLILSLAWHPLRAHVVGFTASNGRVSLLECAEGKLWNENAAVHLIDIHQHDLEAWTLAFSGSQAASVLSGGDDVVLQCSQTGSYGEYVAHWRDRKLHQAGITAILPITSDLAVTGSYDDHIRLISFPTGGRRKVLAEENLGGGVWRLKALATDCFPSEASAKPRIGTPDSDSLVLLASCMHAGSRVVRLCKGENGAWNFEVVASFVEHQSMNYGSDVQPSGSTAKLVVSTSFYDKLLCLWRFDLDQIESRG